jgi:hypothetical protein
MQIEQPKTPLQMLSDEIDVIAYAAKGVRYLKTEFPDTKDYDADQMFKFVSNLMSTSSKINALVMSSDSTVLNSIRLFLNWYASSIDSESIPQLLSQVAEHRSSSLLLTLDLDEDRLSYE